MNLFYCLWSLGSERSQFVRPGSISVIRVPHKHPGEGLNNSSDIHEFNFAVDHTSCNEVLETMGSDVKEDFILIDSGCTSHIENKNCGFASFKSSHNPQCYYIQLADGHKIQGAVQGVGNAHK